MALLTSRTLYDSSSLFYNNLGLINPRDITIAEMLTNPHWKSQDYFDKAFGYLGSFTINCNSAGDYLYELGQNIRYIRTKVIRNNGLVKPFKKGWSIISRQPSRVESIMLGKMFLKTPHLTLGFLPKWWKSCFKIAT